MTTPSEMPPLLHPTPCSSEDPKISSLLPASPSLLQKKDNILDAALSMNTDCPDTSWKCLLAPAKKDGEFELVEELEMRERTGLMRGVGSPCQGLGGGTGSGEAQLDWTDLEDESP